MSADLQTLQAEDCRRVFDAEAIFLELANEVARVTEIPVDCALAILTEETKTALIRYLQASDIEQGCCLALLMEARRFASQRVDL
ncbi:hypothetical protein [Zhongshania aliphaticivorans]|uniref:hypothetical protein n=1 Tax=Zhongshania aliphaticivorans TaxID=1470434 RepID=UPI0012E6DEFE|nr:hypothetical protein [Zhongshania aliphaticivorans]CAA0103232.1 Uncharacterised protein [Zhongshania aliphaticivorans]